MVFVAADVVGDVEVDVEVSELAVWLSSSDELVGGGPEWWWPW